MTVLEDVSQLKSQGKSEQEIISKLQQKGISPKEINDALSQSQIKTAVSSENTLRGTPNQATSQEEYSQPITQEYQPPVSSTQASAQAPAPAPTSQSASQDQYYQEPYASASSGDYGGYDNYSGNYGDYGGYDNYSGNYGDYGGYDNYGQAYGGVASTDTDNIIEIAEQVSSEKMKKIQSTIDDLNEFKTLAQVKISHIDERLQKIEKTIDKLQMAILEKISSYTSGIDSVKKEMAMIEDSFRKVGYKTPAKKRKTTRKRKSKK